MIQAGSSLCSLLVFLTLFLPFLSFAQPPDSSSILREWKVDAKHIFPDAFSNVYLMNHSNELEKLEQDGRIRFQFQDVKLGHLAIVDVSDPLNLLLYYPEFQEILLLDRTLSEVSRVSLTAFGLYAIEAVGYSSDNRIWLYDPMSGTLKKINAEGRVMAESQILAPLLGRMIQPVRIREVNQRVYMICEEGSVLVFDPFGKYMEEVKWPSDMDFQITGRQFFGCGPSGCQVMDSFTRQTRALSLPPDVGTPLEVRLQKGKVYALFPNRLVLLNSW